MTRLHAHRAGASTPESETAHVASAGRIEGQGTVESPNYLQKRIATAQARSALIGLALEALPDGAWRMTYPAFGSAGHVCTLPSLQAAEATLCAFEAIRAYVLEAIVRMGVVR